ncbi:MAG TPA: tripartite tricarboxylate transporter substrate binding protein [Burkholderiales bacterium]|nr:tripartite tricarboxylate transporter substrate binding protein [Burkholderiales bacterium]
MQQRNSGRMTIQQVVFPCTVAILACAGVAWQASAIGQTTYPAKPIRLILPFPPGGSTDIVARLVGQKLTESWGQAVLIENRPGAGGNIAAETAARAAADGYTLFQVNVANAIGATLYPKLTYDLIASFAPVIQLATTPYVLLAHPTVPAKNTAELIALAKKRPGQLNYASAGGGSATHLSGELLKSMAGIDLVHVPYKGTGPAVTALLSGEVDLYFATVPAALPLVEAKKLRALGVTSARRAALMRDVPAIAEAGLKGYETSTWHGILAPAGTPPEIVGKLNVEIARMLAQPAVKERFVGQGLDPVGGTPEQFGAYLKAEISKWAGVVKASGARAE